MQRVLIKDEIALNTYSSKQVDFYTKKLIEKHARALLKKWHM